jgi:O-antigen/teichoic acid export membrane protein
VANSAWSLLAQGISALIGGSVSIYAVRSFSVTEWGHYSTAVALVALFTVLSGAGLGPFALREFTATPTLQGELLGGVAQALALTAAAAGIGLIAVTIALGYPHQVLILTIVLAPLVALAPTQGVLIAAFNARSRLDYAAWFQLAQAAAYGLLAVLVVANAHSIAELAGSNVVAALGSTALGFVLLRRKLGIRPRLGGSLRRSVELLRAAVPFGGIALVGVVYARIDTLMLSLLSSATSVARYAVPWGLMQLTWLVPSVIAGAFFPLLSRRLSSAREEAEALFFLVVRAFLFASVPIAIVFALAAPVLLPLVFGHRYGASVQVLRIMAWTSVFGFQNYILWYAMLASRRERAALFVQLMGLGLNVGANAVAIPLWGPSGAASALVASDFFVVAGQAVLIHRHLFRVPYAEILCKPLAVGAVVVPMAVVISIWSAVGGALFGAMAYAAALLLVGYISNAEWEPAIALIRRPGTLLFRGP